MSHIYEYDTTTGYITGIKPEYLEEVTTGKINEGIKTASLSDFKLGVTIVEPQKPNFKLKEEIGTYLVIPEEIDGTLITGIDQSIKVDPVTGEMWAEELRTINLNYIKLPNTITYIGGGVFKYSGLKNVRIPDSVRTIGQDAFDSNSIKNIYCEAESKPDGWYDGWQGTHEPTVHWGVEM